jgi:hypothetical protein
LILTYIDKGSIRVDGRRLREALQRVIPGKTEDTMGWITQPYFDLGKAEGVGLGRHQGRGEGLRQGRQEGHHDGVVAGETRALTRLLQKRFGTIPVELRQRILDADTATIETWIERAVDATDVHAVFDVKS